MSEPRYEVYEPARQPRPEAPAADLSESPQRQHAGGCGGGSAVERFVFVSGICVVIWLMTGAGYFWPMWVMLGTGIPALLSMGQRARR